VTENMLDMHFLLEFPTDPVNAIIPITLGCSSTFTVNQIATAEGGEQFPIDFKTGDSVAMAIRINSSKTVSVDAILNANTASFTIPAQIADDCRTQWSTWQIVKVHDDGPDTPLCVGSFQRFDGA
jgi:hypothetical protein